MRAFLTGLAAAVLLGGCMASQAPETYTRDTYAVSAVPAWSSAPTSAVPASAAPVSAVPVLAGGAVHRVSVSKGSSPLWDQDAVMERQIARRATKSCGSAGYREIGRVLASVYQIGGGTQFNYDVTIQCRT
ncbi:hypothetical protein RPE78_03265 [Thioclava litoralis]|uniref:Lipoprotein n=1 Tax=Thioclava litoralis TaxID=3076557 RepID=A0ABZ1E2X6_9RHOB|nr:hypothetical protein RPE78_03265 [Thioclava sp. FTW29]